MVGQRYCPVCGQAACHDCAHLALAVPGRDFVRCCIDACQGHRQWKAFCTRYRDEQRREGSWSPDAEDFTWLETAFCDRFLKELRWFSCMDYEWRTTDGLDQGGFYVLLWSRKPERLWWELLDLIERKLGAFDAISFPDLPNLQPDLFISMPFGNRWFDFQ